MSRNINVNPAHYKLAGRERQGELPPASREIVRELGGARRQHRVPGFRLPVVAVLVLEFDARQSPVLADQAQGADGCVQVLAAHTVSVLQSRLAA